MFEIVSCSSHLRLIDFDSFLELTPFVGAATSALAYLLSGIALIPYWSKSPIARVYLAGYASVVYR
jgi:hypothetical protein